MKLALLGGAALAALSLPSDDVLVLHPTEGAALARTASITIGLDLVDIAMVDGDEAVDPSTVDAAWTIAGLSVETAARFEWIDHYERTTAGRALAFTRTLDRIVVDDAAQRDDDDGSLAVAFAWDAEAGEYLRRVAGELEPSDVDATFASLLRVDVDHTDLLAGRSLEIGERYEVELAPDGVAALVLPLVDGANFARVVGEGEADLPSTLFGTGGAFVGLVVERLAGAFEGASLTLVHQGVRTDPDTGREIALAKVLVDLTGHVDVREFVPEHLIGNLTPFIGSTLTLTGEGEFAWDVDGNHLHHLRLPLDLALTATVKKGTPWGDQGGYVMHDVGSAEWEGRLEVEQTTRVR